MQSSQYRYQNTIQRNWAAEWIDRQKRKGNSPDSGYWDKRALSYTVKDSPSNYIDGFLNLAMLEDGDSVLDMGCGPGPLALPLAKSGHKVIAADFSLSMLEKLRESIPTYLEPLIMVRQLDWNEDWLAAGIETKIVDTVIASRSISTFDLQSAIRKMSFTARKKCCATISADYSPRIDNRIFEICDIEPPHESDNVFLEGMLRNLGASPIQGTIKSQRNKTYKSVHEAIEDYQQMIKRCFDNDDRMARSMMKRITPWLEESLMTVSNPDAGTSHMLVFIEPRITTWAFFSWDPNQIH